MKRLLHSNGCLLAVFYILLNTVEGAGFNRCFKCRSRGELGSCKDKFTHDNVTVLEPKVTGVSVVPCTSGWCGKILDRGTNSFKDEEYGSATERFCLQRGPDDNEERCASTTYNHEKVFMCFCQGDLCNGSTVNSPLIFTCLLPLLSLLYCL